VFSLISCKLSSKVYNCHTNKTRIVEGQNWMQAMVEQNLHGPCNSGIHLHLPTASLGTEKYCHRLDVLRHSKGAGWKRSIQRETASAESSNEKGAAPLTPMLPPLSRWARSSMSLKVWKEVWASTLLCKSGTKQWKRYLEKVEASVLVLVFLIFFMTMFPQGRNKVLSSLAVAQSFLHSSSKYIT